MVIRPVADERGFIWEEESEGEWMNPRKVQSQSEIVKTTKDLLTRIGGMTMDKKTNRSITIHIDKKNDYYEVLFVKSGETLASSKCKYLHETMIEIFAIMRQGQLANPLNFELEQTIRGTWMGVATYLFQETLKEEMKLSSNRVSVQVIIQRVFDEIGLGKVSFENEPTKP